MLHVLWGIVLGFIIAFVLGFTAAAMATIVSRWMGRREQRREDRLDAQDEALEAMLPSVSEPRGAWYMVRKHSPPDVVLVGAGPFANEEAARAYVSGWTASGLYHEGISFTAVEARQLDDDQVYISPMEEGVTWQKS